MPAEPTPESPRAPDAARLIRPYAYIDDSGRRHSWHAGYVVDAPDELAVLMSRGAHLEHLD
ncbi:hypothetical protein HUK83_03150 [Endobacter medicaginis]|uniref:Uncharacterized protein n=1 Tax=Endobacter medicaginis TaxID=1181271 RepID=A0A850NTI1_9PROT|nr:hypothetical protein [Endobacter medicaginis]